MDDAYHLIATVPKNTREELRVALSEYKGVPFIDIRIFADGKHDDRSPTKAGVTVRPERLDDFLAAIEAAREEAIRRGLI